MSLPRVVSDAILRPGWFHSMISSETVPPTSQFSPYLAVHQTVKQSHQKTLKNVNLLNSLNNWIIKFVKASNNLERSKELVTKEPDDFYGFVQSNRPLHATKDCVMHTKQRYKNKCWFCPFPVVQIQNLLNHHHQVCLWHKKMSTASGFDYIMLRILGLLIITNTLSCRNGEKYAWSVQ